MTNKLVSGDSSVDSYPPHHMEGVRLEGRMLKRGIRARQWNDRYFVLNGGTLSYFEQRDDDKPKCSLSISNEAGCEIGSLYIDQRQKGQSKELLYCIKIVWSSDDPGPLAIGDSMPESAPSTNAGPARNRSSMSRAATPARHETETWLEPTAEVVSQAKNRSAARSPSPVPPSGSFEEEGGPLRRFSTPKLPKKSEGHLSTKSEGTTAANNTKPHGGNDNDSVSSPPTRKHRRIFSLGGHSEAEEPLSPTSPPNKENKRTVTIAPRASTGEPEDSAMQLFLTPYAARFDGQQTQEQQLMQSLYLATKKANKRKTKKKIIEGSKIAVAAGAAISAGVLTAGLGLIAGVIFLGVGAAAGGTSIAAGTGFMRKKKRNCEIVMASQSYEIACRWKSALDACLATEILKDSTWGQMFVMEGRNTTTALVPTMSGRARIRGGSTLFSEGFDIPRSTSFCRREESTQFVVDPETRWRPMEGGWLTLFGTGSQGLHIFREETQARKEMPSIGLSVEGRPCPPLKSQVVLNASALNSFMCLMSLGRLPPSVGHLSPLVPNSSQRASFRIVENIDDNMDIIHLVCRPLYLFPSWTTPRDFVLFRYWRLEPDGTYVVCCESVHHLKCPPHPEYTRGEMHCVYTISPMKKERSERGNRNGAPRGYQESLLTSVVQVDPRGWVPHLSIPFLSNQSYGEAFGVAALLQMLDIRDALDQDRFVPVSLDTRPLTKFTYPSGFGPTNRTSMDRMNVDLGATVEHSVSSDSTDDDDPCHYDFSYCEREAVTPANGGMGILRDPPTLPRDKWAQPDANSFRVRGKAYTRDKQKINAGRSIGRLIAVDVVNVEKPIYSGFCAHPTERVQRALAREKRLVEKGQVGDMPPFVFVVNLVLPGPPFYHGVFYYAVDDMSSIDGSDGTPSSKLCKEFFFGECDLFRDKTFKLIPQIVEGNFIVRKAVGSTPAIMGTKLRQLYVRSNRFCEVVLDCGSSSVATGVIRLSLGYAKTLVVDMGFLFEGNDVTTLPERIFGCVRIKKLDFGPHLRVAPQPPEIPDVSTKTPRSPS